MKVLLLAFLSIYLSFIPGEVEELEIPIVVIQTSTMNQVNDLSAEDINQLFNEGLNDYFGEMTQGHLKFIPVRNFIKSEKLTNSIKYHEAVDKGLESILSVSNISWKTFDKDKNGYLENDELIVVNILPLVGKYNDPLAAYYPLENFEVEKGIYLNQMIQFGHKETFSTRTSTLTESTVSHEVGHYLGLVDLYDTDLSSKGLGPMSLMSEIHSDKPIQLDPWSKLQLGFQKPIVLLDSGSYLIEEDKIYRINTKESDVYFLIEYRSLTGYDASLKALGLKEGIYIYKINERVIKKNKATNTVNNTDNNLGIQWMNRKDIEYADIVIKKQSNQILLYRK